MEALDFVEPCIGANPDRRGAGQGILPRIASIIDRLLASRLRETLPETDVPSHRTAQLLVQLGVFVGSFSIPAALSVVDAWQGPESPLEELGSLIAAGYLEPIDGGRLRIRMRTTIAPHDAAKLRAAARERHARHFAALAASDTWTDQDNFLAALRTLIVDRGGVHLGDVAVLTAAVEASFADAGEDRAYGEFVEALLRAPRLPAWGAVRLRRVRAWQFHWQGYPRLAHRELRLAAALAEGDRDRARLLADCARLAVCCGALRLAAATSRKAAGLAGRDPAVCARLRLVDASCAQARGDFRGMIGALLDAERLAMASGDATLIVAGRSLRVLAHHLAGEPSAAEDAAEGLDGEGLRSADPRERILALLRAGVVAHLQGRRSAAADRVRRAAALVSGRNLPLLGNAVALLAAWVDGAGADHRSAIVDALRATRPQTGRQARFLFNLLVAIAKGERVARASFAVWDSGFLLAQLGRIPRPADLVVAADGRSFFTERSGWVDLSRKRTLGRILVALAKAAEGFPSRALAFEELVDAGWPGEKIIRHAARNRLNVCLSQLRRMGLRPFLERHGDAYRLVGNVVVQVPPEERPEAGRSGLRVEAPANKLAGKNESTSAQE